MVRLWVQEVRLNRALEEAERAKAALAAERTNKRGDVQQERKDVEKLEGGYRLMVLSAGRRCRADLVNVRALLSR